MLWGRDHNSNQIVCRLYSRADPITREILPSSALPGHVAVWEIYVAMGELKCFPLGESSVHGCRR